MKSIQFKKVNSLLLVVVLLMFAANSVQAALYTSGHADIGLAEEDGLELHFHSEGGIVDGVSVEDEYEPDEIVIVVPNSTMTTRPSGSQWDMIGNNAGDSIWILPQSNVSGVPFLGIGAEEASSGTYLNNEITLSLLSMTGPSGGEFSMWQTDGFGTPTFYMSTFDSGTDAITLDLDVSDHIHVNWSFTQPGEYQLEFQSSADLVGGGSGSSIATFTFNVVPEPATMCLFGLGAVLLRRRACH
jgi:surface-anchored protein